MIERRIYLNEKRPTVSIDVIQGMVGQPIRLIIADEKLDPETEARVYVEKPSGLTVYQPAELTDQNVVTITPVTQTFIEPGTSKMTIQLMLGEVILYSFVILANVQKNPAMNEGGTESTNYDYFLRGAEGPAGPPGNPGPAGKDGSDGQDGFSPSISVTDIEGGHAITITNKDGSSTFNVMDGQDGSDGSDGQDGHSPVVTATKSGDTTTIYVDGTAIATIEDGTDGHSPAITASKTGRTTTIYADGTAIASVQDGSDGQDGFSPTVSITDITGGHAVTITDKNGAHTFNIMDGVDGQDGSDGQDGTDGFSPTITITDITGGHTVTVTNASGSTAFNIMDGVDGDDYVLTAQDKQDIADLVLADLPAWTGGAY